MLAVPIENPQKLSYPVLVSPKLDGIRCLKVNGKAVTRKFKPVPNDYVREWIERNLPDGLDGELMAGNSFNEAQSLIMSKEGEPNFVYWVFDYVRERLDTPFISRYAALNTLVASLPNHVQQHIGLVEHKIINNFEELKDTEQYWVSKQFEGIMIRALNGPYKNGRSTLREEYLLKLKRFEDSEAEIIGFEEQMSNQNVAEIDELGYTKRSSCKGGLVPAGLLGRLLVRDLKTGMTFGVGTGDGLTKELRKHIWDNRNTYMGQIIKYKYQPSGQKELPRFPVWLGFRHHDDM
jgi:DNA ligase-1